MFTFSLPAPSSLFFELQNAFYLHYSIPLSIFSYPCTCPFYPYDKDSLWHVSSLSFSHWKGKLIHQHWFVRSVYLRFSLAVTSACLWLINFNPCRTPLPTHPIPPVIVMKHILKLCVSVHVCLPVRESRHARTVCAWNHHLTTTLVFHRRSPPITVAIILCKPHKHPLWGITVFCWKNKTFHSERFPGDCCRLEAIVLGWFSRGCRAVRIR